MTQSRTAALNGLESLIRSAVEGAGATFFRDPEHDPEAPAAGLVIMQDGDPGEAEIDLSPVRFNWEHKVEFEILVQGPARRTISESLIALFDPALATDRTLGGLVDYAAVLDAPEAEDNEPHEDGVAPTRVTYLAVTLIYATTSATG